MVALAGYDHSNDLKCFRPRWTSSSLSIPLTFLYELRLSTPRFGSHGNSKQGFPLNRESGFFALIQYPLPLSFLGEFEQQDRLGRIRFQNGNTFQRAQRAA